MKPGEVQTYLPPPPHQIVEYLNGHIIGHYVMKKAISVAIYNHFCNINFSRLDDSSIQCHEEALVEDAKHYFDRQNPSVAKISEDKEVIKDLTAFDGGEAEEEYMSPVVARVIIEAASHKVRLRGPNVLTFDSTGPSKPVNAICSTIAQLFDIPFLKCDCSQLCPVANVKEPEVQGSPLRNKVLKRNMSNVEDPKLQGGRRGSLTLLLEGLEDSNKTVAKKSKPRRKTAPPIQINDNHGHRRGSLNELLQGLNENKETINSVISKLYRKANFESDKAQRAIIFLDGMDKIGQNVSVSELARKQVLKEIVQVLDGTVIDVTRAGSTENESIDTSQIFFVCFGNFDEKGSGDVNYAKQKNTIQLLQPPKFNHEIKSPTNSAGSSCSEDSGNGSGENRSSNLSRQFPSMCTDQSSEGYISSDEDDSFEGLRENKLAQQLLYDSKTSPIAYYQSLWGMKDVQLKFTPEALEIIANQATIQNAGQDGVATILEKLFINIKFDILGCDVYAVDINEDVVLGKKRPIYHLKKPKKIRNHFQNNIRKMGHLCAISEENSMEFCRPKIRLPTTLTDYERAISNEIEI